jgi:hypothetical protein
MFGKHSFVKRAGHIILIIFLLISTGGISISRHYCGESVVSVSLFSTARSCCGSGCDKCRTENSFNKVTDNFTLTSLDVHQTVVSANPFHSNFIIDIFLSLPVNPLAVIIKVRKFLYQKPGDFPVTFGNFRC